MTTERTMTPKHSPLPWIWDEPGNWHGLSARICTEKYEPIAQVQLSGWPRKIGLANAAFLVRAANSYDALVEACEDAMKLWDRKESIDYDQGEVDQIRAALQLARKEG